MSSRKIEYFDAAGLRRDGRREAELRPLTVVLGGPSAARGDADGEASVVGPGTHVRAVVHGPRPAAGRARYDARPDCATFSCDVAVAAWSSARRRTAQRRTRPACLDLAALVTDALAPVLMLSQYPQSHIHVAVDVLQADGNERAACINAAALALADANIAMRDLVVAATAALLDGSRVVVDPTAAELASGCPVWLEATLAHDPEALALVAADARLQPSEEEQAVDALHAACGGACMEAATVALDAMRGATAERLGRLDAAGVPLMSAEAAAPAAMTAGVSVVA
jgi:exosome complex component RRP41